MVRSESVALGWPVYRRWSRLAGRSPPTRPRLPCTIPDVRITLSGMRLRLESQGLTTERNALRFKVDFSVEGRYCVARRKREGRRPSILRMVRSGHALDCNRLAGFDLDLPVEYLKAAVRAC